MNQVRHRTLGWGGVAAGIVLAGVVVLSLGPDVNPRSGLVGRFDHVIAYAVLTGVLLVARDRHGRGWSEWVPTPLLCLGIVAFAAAMEVGQAAVHRDADVMDWLAGSAGVATMASAHLLFRLLSRNQTRARMDLSPASESKRLSDD